jgi:hypothetical protein
MDVDFPRWCPVPLAHFYGDAPLVERHNVAVTLSRKDIKANPDFGAFWSYQKLMYVVLP